MNITNSIGLFKEKVALMLEEDEISKNYIVSQINDLSGPQNEKHLFSSLLELFVHLSFEEGEAKNHWDKIFENYKYFESKLDRNVGLRVAMFDYFINLNHMLSNPMLVEIRIFRETEKLAMIDSLSGLFNRRYFDIAVSKELKRSKRFDKVFSLLMIDFDNFKSLNDLKGHLFGDDIISKFSQLIKKHSREEDIACRYGGDEFVIVLPETTGDGALKYAERIRQNIQEEGILKMNNITFSGGIATYPYDGKSPVHLIENADKSLYAAKYSGKNCVIKFKSENRRFTRFNHSWKLCYQLLGDTFKKMAIKEIYTQDVSLGGIRFETSDVFKIDEKLLLDIQLPDNNEIIVVGKVVWMKKVDDSTFAYGIQFFDINSDQLKIIKNILPQNNNIPEE